MNRTNVILLLFCFITCLYACKAPTLTRAEDHSQKVEATPGRADSTLNALIGDYRKQLEAEMNTVIGTVAQSLTLQKPESSLGNWMADVLWEKATYHSKRPVDFALQNYGGIRISELPAGPINRGKIYELMPFDNQLVILDLPGTIVDTLVQHLCQDGVWPCSRALKIGIQNGQLQHMALQGAPIFPSCIYRVAMPDFIADGGGRCFFLQGHPREDLGIMIRDVLIDYIEEQERLQRPLQAQIDGRVEIIDP